MREHGEKREVLTFYALRDQIEPVREKQRPGRKQLHERRDSGEIRLVAHRVLSGAAIDVYSNGYICYTADSRWTVFFVDDAVPPYGTDIAIDDFNALAWDVAAALTGEERIRKALFNSGWAYWPDAADSDEENAFYRMLDGVSECDIEEDYILHETWDEALSLLAALQRRAVEMYYGDGFTEAEIASILGKNRGTVHKALFQARKKLADFFAADTI